MDREREAVASCRAGTSHPASPFSASAAWVSGVVTGLGQVSSRREAQLGVLGGARSGGPSAFPCRALRCKIKVFLVIFLGRVCYPDDINYS